ncbi:MAG TPA: glycosyltransferase [Acidimicrobiales bacterium]|nr:glycosyltransferase [Acidimicrobiales bacterium]
MSAAGDPGTAGDPGAGRGTRRLRVLWLVKGLGIGGAERLLVAGAGARDEAGFAIEAAYVVPVKSQLVGDLEERGVPVTCLGGGRPGAWVPRLRALLVSGRFDVVHVHSPLLAGTTRLAVRTLPKRRRPAIVTTEHNGWSTFTLTTRLLNAFTAPLDDATIAVSEETRASMWWPGTRRRTAVLVHGVDLDTLRSARRHRAAVRRQLGLVDDDVAVMTVANYREQKAWPDLLAAARAVIDRGLPVRFVTVGQGPLQAEIEALHRRLELGDRVLLLGRRDDVPSLLAAADVFVLASTYEGYPLAVMEALGAGLPVVATAVGGVVDAVGPDSGVLVPPGRPDLLAEAVARVATDPGERARLAAGAARAGDAYDVATAVAATETIYRRIAPPAATERPAPTRRRARRSGT